MCLTSIVCVLCEQRRKRRPHRSSTRHGESTSFGWTRLMLTLRSVACTERGPEHARTRTPTLTRTRTDTHVQHPITALCLLRVPCTPGGRTTLTQTLPERTHATSSAPELAPGPRGLTPLCSTVHFPRVYSACPVCPTVLCLLQEKEGEVKGYDDEGGSVLEAQVNKQRLAELLIISDSDLSRKHTQLLGAQCAVAAAVMCCAVLFLYYAGAALCGGYVVSPARPTTPHHTTPHHTTPHHTTPHHTTPHPQNWRYH